ncbi:MULTISPECIES: DUF3545 family protein [Salinivibrio]|jgi:hypothetical protein|uniref:DUF3545 domain-containing protein n=1 Tax=Salinivibrio costicola subsp. alcaliphilus TaxID=272773 RepID=A0ABX3KSB5_SALCS|nr:MULTISPECIES: DUF3545 family protein [Salinivibrio]NUY57141.1 DUF3545 family protein [Salinivibrio sp. EAGSL]OOE94227.1 DUF3545 domain-containing protein [Salinivibrio sp. AR647]OOF00281.1 DUF3545 domain-containing protein [Salinivibrio sp. MA427]OOF01335.1 DUF3545 domain-containing protein [Salinivibrio sp. MA351]OOF05452.1 DUF3545 domain-containing protein [Salinivibrio sp. MA607]
MENIAFNDMFEQDPPRRNGRAKPVKRKWREIEALKDKQRLKKELEDIDIFGDFSQLDLD